MPKSLYLFLLCLMFSVPAMAQNSKTGSWGILTVLMPGDSIHRWGGYAETQVRSNGSFLSQFNYWEAKAGVSFDINKYFVGLVGVLHNASYDYTDLSKGATGTENRLWEQMSVTQYLSRIKIEHRYRVEQRWLSNNTYKNRIRYRLNLFIPLNGTTIRSKTWFVSAYDEIFLNNTQPNFERNRISAALGYQFDRSWILQAGWVDQYDYTLIKSNLKNNMMINLMYRINRKNGAHREHLPTTSG